MIHQDWMMRQIEMMIDALLRLLFPDRAERKESDALSRELQAWIELGQIGKAEDLLFERLNPENAETVIAAIEFYRTLNQISDAELEAQDFSRTEILSGLQDLCRMYGINEMLLDLLSSEEHME